MEDLIVEERQPTWTCRRCERTRPLSDGCDDMFPHLCDDCWVKVSMAPEAVAYRKRIKKP